MMYKVVIFAAAIAVAVAGESEESAGTRCTPGAVLKVDCNTCRCSEDGSALACTKMACPPVVNDEGHISGYPADEPCTPNESFRYYCNTCFCSKNGVGAACTRMACPPGLFNKDGSINVPEGKPVPRDVSAVSEEVPELPKDGTCEEGKSYKKECNSCHCGKNNAVVCTQMFCGIPSVLRASATESNWGPFYEQGSPCEPNTLFLSECNQCRCLEDGKHAACTLKACPVPPGQE